MSSIPQAENGRQGDLLGTRRSLPDGFDYQPEFLTPTVECGLLAVIATLPLEEAEYRERQTKRRMAAITAGRPAGIGSTPYRLQKSCTIP